MSRINYANFRILRTDPKTGALVIKDVGPWNKFKTITNDAEGVVEKLFAMGELKAGQRLMYWDSEGEFDELLIENQKFIGFKSGHSDLVAQEM